MAQVKLITEFVDSVKVTRDKSDTLFVEGIFSTANLRNKNGRVYKKETLDREIKKLNESIKSKCLWGELNHPTTPDINLERAAILIEKLDWDGDNIVGRAKVLDTPMGQIAKTLIKEGAIGISSRGLGTVDEGGTVNDSSYQMLTFDLVSNPSNSPSWLNGIYEGSTFEVSSSSEEDILTEEEAKKQYGTYILSELKKILD